VTPIRTAQASGIAEIQAPALRARLRSAPALVRDCMTMHRGCIVALVMHNAAGRPAPATTTILGEPPVSGLARP
jgi:hypothetical protein